MNNDPIELNQTQHNYIYYSKAFFKLKISHYLPSASNMLFMVLLYEANELGFPERFNLPNSTLAREANIKQSNLSRDRQKLLDFRLYKNNPDSWLVRYETGYYPEAGEYLINYELLSEVNHNLSTVKAQSKHRLSITKAQGQQKVAKNDHIHIQEKTNETKNNNTVSDDDAVSQEIKDTIKETLLTHKMTKSQIAQVLKRHSWRDIAIAFCDTRRRYEVGGVDNFIGYFLEVLKNGKEN